MMSLTEQTKVKKVANILKADLGGSKIVLLDAKCEEYFGLEDAGARIWELLEGERSIADLCRALVSEFEVDYDRCREDTTSVISELIRVGLLSVAETDDQAVHDG